MARQPDNTVTVVVNGASYTGWESVRISRSCERMPPDFDIIGTERNPNNGALALLNPGSPCTVMIGSDQVLQGYIDRYLPSIGPAFHQVQIQGRGLCEDLVDCSIEPEILPGMQIVTSSLLDLATQLCAKFGSPPPIKVVSLTGDNVPVATPNSNAPLMFNATLQQTPYEILEETSRYAGVLIYENGQGQLVLANVGGEGTMASGFSQGVNVQQASAIFTMDQRYSKYLPTLMATDFFGSVGGTPFAPVFDPGVPRYRPLFVVSEQFIGDQSLAEKRAIWEEARRAGRSNALRVTCDSWRDSAGRLWAPNAFAPIDIPVLKLGALSEPWVISSVDFIRDAQRGTVADLVLMPKNAFLPEPFNPTSANFFYNPNDPGAVPSAGGGAQPSPTTGGAGSAPSSPAPAGGGGASPAPIST